MGYYTNWEGELDLSRQLTLDEFNVLQEELEKEDFLPELRRCWYSVQVNKEGTKLDMGDDSGKTYYWQETLQHLIDTFFEPKGIKLNGKLKWYGEEAGDLGKVKVEDSIITVTDLGAQIEALMDD